MEARFTFCHSPLIAANSIPRGLSQSQENCLIYPEKGTPIHEADPS